MRKEITNPRPPVLLIYDRQCPLCDNYCRMVRLRASAGELRLINARDPGAEVDRISAAGLDVDQGMVLMLGEQIYYGADAIHALALITGPSGAFNRISAWMFRSKARAKVLYPMMRCGRNLLLKILGRSKINNLSIAGNDKF